MTIHIIVNLNKLIVRLFKQCMMIGINVGHRHIKITCFGVVSIHSYLIRQRPLEEVNSVFKLQRILLCLAILTLLLCEYNCKSETRRRAYKRVPSIGKRNFAYGKVMEVYVCNKSFLHSRQ